VEVWGLRRRQMLISSYDGGTCTHVPLATPLIAARDAPSV